MKNVIQNEIESRIKIAHATHSVVGYSDNIQIVFCYECDAGWKAQSYNPKQGTFANWIVEPESVRLVD